MAFTFLAACSQPVDEHPGDVEDSDASQGMQADSGSTDTDPDGGDAGESDTGQDVVCGSPDDDLRLSYYWGELEGCDVFLGGINFGDYTFTDLSEFPSLRVIEGRVNLFRNEYLESLRGLERLERVGELILHHSVVLDDLSELSSLRQIDRRLIVNSNRGLTHLRGLERLRSVSELSIRGNPNLESLDGLERLERVRGDLTIEGNGIPQSKVQAFLDRVEVEGETHVDF